MVSACCRSASLDSWVSGGFQKELAPTLSFVKTGKTGGMLMLTVSYPELQQTSWLCIAFSPLSLPGSLFCFLGFCL